MTQPWPEDPNEKARKLKELHLRYQRVFAMESSKKNMNTKIITATTTSEKAEKTNIQHHRIQNLAFFPASKSTQQLKREAQFERMRLAQQTNYSLEPTFMIPDSVICVPKLAPEAIPETTIPETDVSSTVNQKIIEEQDYHTTKETRSHDSDVDTLLLAQELEINIRPEEQHDIEQSEPAMPLVPPESKRKQKKRLWVSKIEKKKI
ncbi:unnamed protein product [Macrosiphum euphorbiae]|uniref:Uncharacterized protein n=1 Tax=Macrosiphum euphorbiae TaxID=13131 RepID=A0AAV0Y355_9HEMI|nr:unnamed protein product [Macrosiphum euphorbiae]